MYSWAFFTIPHAIQCFQLPLEILWKGKSKSVLRQCIAKFNCWIENCKLHPFPCLSTKWCQWTFFYFNHKKMWKLFHPRKRSQDFLPVLSKISTTLKWLHYGITRGLLWAAEVNNKCNRIRVVALGSFNSLVTKDKGIRCLQVNSCWISCCYVVINPMKYDFVWFIFLNWHKGFKLWTKWSVFGTLRQSKASDSAVEKGNIRCSMLESFWDWEKKSVGRNSSISITSSYFCQNFLNAIKNWSSIVTLEPWRLVFIQRFIVVWRVSLIKQSYCSTTSGKKNAELLFWWLPSWEGRNASPFFLMFGVSVSSLT